MRKIDPEMQAWFAANKVGTETIPPHNPDCEVIFRGSAPVIHFPVNGSEYYISKKNPEPLQLICRTANDVSHVSWYINDRFYKSTPAREKQFFLPEEGPVKITVTDDKGRNRHIRILVKYVNL